MRGLRLNAILICFVTSTAPVVFAQDSARIEKIAEGQYLQWQEGHAIQDTAQIWTIWRTSDGYEVEDKLPMDNGVLLMAALGAELDKKMSPQLREGMKSLTMTTDIHLRLTKQGAIEALQLSGKKISDSKQIEIATCHVKENEIACKGHAHSMHLRDSGQDQLLYPYPFPLLFLQILRQSRLITGQTIPLALSVLEEANDKFRLSKVPGELRGDGPEKIVIGQYSFDADKFVLSFDDKKGPRRIALWASRQGVVFAMEDSRFASGVRILLSQYKKYSEF